MRYRQSAMIGRISLRARAAALLPLAALGVHDLRYRLAYGGDAGHELARQGHAYLGIAKPLVGVLCALVAAELVARLARAWRIGEAAEQNWSRSRLWALADGGARRRVLRPGAARGRDLRLLAADRGVRRALQPRRRRRALTDQCYVKVYDEVGPATSPTTTRRAAGSTAATASSRWSTTRTSTSSSTSSRSSKGPDALRAMRELMLRSLPDSVYPLEVRTVGADDAFLSPQYETRDDRHLGVGQAGHRLLGLPALGRRAARRLRRARALGQAALPHARAAPRAVSAAPTTSSRIRRELDPEGVFLNDHLRPLFW